MIDDDHIKELLRVKDKYLYHREGQELEFKEQFNLAGLADYFRDFAAFANNRGGYLIFGVKDSPRIPVGLSDSKKKGRYEIVAGAHMELAEPGIMETVDEIAGENPEMIVIAPYFLYEGMHIKKDIPEMIEEMSAKYPGIKFRFAKPIGFEPMLADIMLSRAAEAEKEA